MIAKRFEMIITGADGSFHYLDKNTGEKITSTLELENKLNELHEENKELKQSIHDWQGSYDELYEDNLKLEKENKELKKQMNRLYNYFIDWHSDEMGGNQFSEMWDIVKESEEWEKR